MAPSVPVVWARPQTLARAGVDLVARLDERLCVPEVASQEHRAEAEPVHEHRATVLVSELLEDREAL